jgi:hypothetical protein
MHAPALPELKRSIVLPDVATALHILVRLHDQPNEANPVYTQAPVSTYEKVKPNNRTHTTPSSAHARPEVHAPSRARKHNPSPGPLTYLRVILSIPGVKRNRLQFQPTIHVHSRNYISATKTNTTTNKSLSQSQKTNPLPNPPPPRFKPQATTATLTATLE